jgi:hypothetical protein
LKWHERAQSYLSANHGKSRYKESALRACRRGPVHLFMGTAVRADRRAAALNLTD